MFKELSKNLQIDVNQGTGSKATVIKAKWKVVMKNSKVSSINFITSSEHSTPVCDEEVESIMDLTLWTLWWSDGGMVIIILLGPHYLWTELWRSFDPFGEIRSTCLWQLANMIYPLTSVDQSTFLIISLVYTRIVYFT